MAAAAIHGLRDSIHHRLHKSEDERSKSKPDVLHNSNSQPAQRPHHTHEEETQLIQSWEGQKHVLEPEEVCRAGEEKHMGTSSNTLSCDDFNLLKTLGTGALWETGAG